MPMALFLSLSLSLSLSFSRREQHTAIMMHKILHNRAPEYLTEEINLVRDGSAYSLRDSIYNLALQKPRTEILIKSFSYRGAKL